MVKGTVELFLVSLEYKMSWYLKQVIFRFFMVFSEETSPQFPTHNSPARIKG